MSLDLTLYEVDGVALGTLSTPRRAIAYEANITHNLNRLAREVMLYEVLWHPEDYHIEMACDLINPIERGLFLLKKYPERYETFGAKTGWGTYGQFVRWLEKLLVACEEHPRAQVEVWR